MKKRIFFLHLLVMLVAFGLAPQIYAATSAEASTGHNTATIGKYDLSHLSAEERSWFKTFLKGNFFSDGWEQISSDILSNTAAHKREKQKVVLHKLGLKIGSEWCKGNDTRRINTSMLRKWGNELKTTAETEPHLLAEVLQRIDQEVDSILN